ncbi:hypothetical protein GYMLUDRAFT_63384 [Collybiopsis luxurians FD-317 M1]|uniref:Unplaced genomic scaffold GYMLUscaffold_72, whole genome shotgun sequence n=1 Tax=Collybiopsis luxurians FD-317 M1 TaxID=944289 RepID=A0A0D0BH52_9AGAR|nr:hypothetical protein GYMLUDRAFT_63384 [Collybiopsis luxurians FD-317 M1]
MDFDFTIKCECAMDKLKNRISSPPILIKTNFEQATLITPLPRTSDKGLMVVGCDSSWMGARWVQYQHFLATSVKLWSAKNQGLWIIHLSQGSPPLTHYDPLSMTLQLLFKCYINQMTSQMPLCFTGLHGSICLFNREFHHIAGSAMKMEDALSHTPYIDIRAPDSTVDAEEFLNDWELGINLKFLLKAAWLCFTSPFDLFCQSPMSLYQLISSSIQSNLIIPSFGSLPAEDNTHSLLTYMLANSCKFETANYADFYIRMSAIPVSDTFLLGNKVVELEYI